MQGRVGSRRLLCVLFLCIVHLLVLAGRREHTGCSPGLTHREVPASSLPAALQPSGVRGARADASKCRLDATGRGAPVLGRWGGMILSCDLSCSDGRWLLFRICARIRHLCAREFLCVFKKHSLFQIFKNYSSSLPKKRFTLFIFPS